MINSKLKVILVSNVGTETRVDNGCAEFQTAALIQHLADNCSPKELLSKLKEAYKYNAYERKHTSGLTSQEIENLSFERKRALDKNLEEKKIFHEKEFKNFLNLLKELD